MTLKHKYLLYITALITASIACKKPYSPSIDASSKNYLVVEGVVNSGNDSTFIKLSRTVELVEGITTNAEKGATITVDADGGSDSYVLTEIAPGNYACGPLNLDNARQYRLKIKTKSGQNYESDAMAVKITPPIDEIGYKIKPTGLQINVTAHDATNNTRYYRWDYVETWKFHSKYKSNYISNGKQMVLRADDEDIYSCFSTRASTNIIIGSTSKLSQDLVSELPITDIVASSQKISVRYSILLKQYALTKQAYEFWVNLQKNTEQLGSIFDAQPSEIMGNIHNTANPAEPVIGFIEVGTVQTKRVFIDRTELPDWATAYPEDCALDTTLYVNENGGNDVAAFLVPKLALAVDPIKEGDAIKGFLRTAFECADCTLTGTKSQPAFWQ